MGYGIMNPQPVGKVTKTGNLFIMTQNNNGQFNCLKLQGGPGTIYFESGEPYLAFDNNYSSNRNATINVTGTYFGCQIDCVKPIIPLEIQFNAYINTNGRARVFYIRGWRPNIGWETIYSLNVGGWDGAATNSGTLNIGNNAAIAANTLYSSFSIYYEIGSGNDGAAIQIRELQITKWKQ